MPELRLSGGDVDGLLVNYLVEGPARGHAVVLIHGLGGFAETWRHNVAPLAERATVYALDLPGFGRSGKPRARYGLTFFARVVHGFLDALRISHASLVGHSLGGAVAITYALVHPARVERLALIAAVVPGFSYRPSWIYRTLMLPGVGEALALCGSARVYKAALARCFHRAVPDEIDFFVDSFYAERTAWSARAAYLSTLRETRRDFEVRAADYRRVMAGLGTPVLLIHGRQDPVVPAAHCEEVAGAVPRAAVRWLEDCGHFPHLEHARVVNDLLAEFVAGRAAPR
jgi:pimeloyl-ACP methyl ester carboxylesterase